MAALVRQSFALPPELVAGRGQPPLGAHVAHGLLVAWWQGREFDNLIDGGVKLGEEPEPVPASAADDDGEGTSCGLEEEDDDGGVEEKKSINV